MSETLRPWEPLPESEEDKKIPEGEMTPEGQDEIVAKFLGEEEEFLKESKEKAEHLQPERRNKRFKKISTIALTSVMAGLIAFGAVPKSSEAGGQYHHQQQRRGLSTGEAVAVLGGLVVLGGIFGGHGGRNVGMEREEAERNARFAREEAERNARQAREEAERKARFAREEAERGRHGRINQRGEQEREVREDIAAVNKMSPEVQKKLARERAHGDFVESGRMVIRSGHTQTYLDEYVTSFIEEQRAERDKVK